MLVLDLVEIGNKIYDIRKRKGLSRAQVAELAGLSDRTYADIERGSVNMRVKTILKICSVLKINPDEIFTTEGAYAQDRQSLLSRLNTCSEAETETAIKLLTVYLDSINK